MTLVTSGNIPLFKENHPLRPKRPSGMPMAGDDNHALRTWERACELCRHNDAELGCTAFGLFTYTNGMKSGMPKAIGGCTRWWLKGIGK